MYSYAPYPATQIHVAAPPTFPAPVAQTIRPVFNVIPNPGSADALRRVQNQMAAQRVAMAQMKENLGYVRQVVDGLKAELALQDSGKKAVTFKDLARLKKYIDINRASIKTLQDKDRELDLQVLFLCCHSPNSHAMIFALCTGSAASGVEESTWTAGSSGPSGPDWSSRTTRRAGATGHSRPVRACLLRRGA